MLKYVRMFFSLLIRFNRNNWWLMIVPRLVVISDNYKSMCLKPSHQFWDPSLFLLFEIAQAIGSNPCHRSILWASNLTFTWVIKLLQVEQGNPSVHIPLYVFICALSTSNNGIEVGDVKNVPTWSQNISINMMPKWHDICLELVNIKRGWRWHSNSTS